MTADDAGTVPHEGPGPAATVPAPSNRWRAALKRLGRWRRGYQAWRRSRPFWGGLLLVLAGLEMLAIPLLGVLVHGAIKLVIYIGIGGVFGVLIGALLIAAGLALWINPTHRSFYGIAGIILGLASFPASNLGGFLLGMLLAIIGGALGFAWTVRPQLGVPASTEASTAVSPETAVDSAAETGAEAGAGAGTAAGVEATSS